MKYDDVGSMPLPENVGPEELERGISKKESWAKELIDDLMEVKIDSGVEVPSYPQIRPMIEQFNSLFKKDERCEEEFLLKKGTRLPELEMAGENAKKACLTGPFELSLSEFGEPREKEMKKIGTSLKRLVEGENLEVVSIDEPSLGINPPYDFDVETLIEAWNNVCSVDALVEIHLHSLYFQETVCRAEIDVIDCPTAGNNRNLNLVDEEMLNDYGMKVRVGISRTDVVSEEDASTPEEVVENLNAVKGVLGGMIEYCGPDCGLGGVKSLEMARKILEKTYEGIKIYRKK